MKPERGDIKGVAQPVKHECLVCGTTCLVTANLFLGEDDRWDCPSCGTWGTIAHKRGSTTGRTDDSHES